MKIMHKKTLLGLCFITFVFFLIFNGVKINKMYPSYKSIRYSLSEQFYIDNIGYTFNNFEILKHEDFISKYPSAHTYKDEQINIIINLEIENKDNVKRNVSMSNFLLESNGWSTNMSIYTFFSLNNFVSESTVTLKPKEKKSLTLPFTYYKLYNEEIDYYKFINNSFFLNCYVKYPEKIGVIL